MSEESPGRWWLQFVVTRLLLGACLISGGIAGLVRLSAHEMTGWGDVGEVFGIFYGSIALIGAGLGSFFQRRLLGAALGAMLAVLLVFWVAAIVMVVNQRR